MEHNCAQWNIRNWGITGTKNCFLTFLLKHNKLVKLVVQVKYHMNVIYSLGGGHTHTNTHTHNNLTDKSNFKKLGTCWLQGVPSLKTY